MRRFRSENGGPTTQQRPPILAANGIHVLVRREDVEARKILEQFARSSFDSLKLWPPKSYFFSPSRRCVIAYAVANNIAICLGDPVGPEPEIEMTAREFLKKCKKKRWGVAFYRTSADFLPVYRRLGLRKLKIGDDALVDLGQFSLNGRSKRDIRSKANHFQQLGMSVVKYQPPLASETLAKLTSVEEQWLAIPGRRERTFAVGHFDQSYLRSTPVLAVVDGAGQIFAFVNVISVNPGEIAGDIMRRRCDAPNGITDYLLLKLIQYAREKRCNRVSLGLAPMTGFKKGESAKLEERVIHSVLRKLDFLFRFRGLSQYKTKFATSSEPRYLIYKNLLQLPRGSRTSPSLGNQGSRISSRPKPPDADEQQAMSSLVRIQNRVVIVIALYASVFAQSPQGGKNTFTIRGQEQRVYLYQAAITGHHHKILFAPGDAGCRGFAVAIAERLVKAGYDTYCLDVLHYLESFTGKSILTTDQIASDFNQIARWIQQKDHEPILLLGWSEGAGLGLAAAATQENKALFDGIIAIGIPEGNILAWRWKDVGAWLTKKPPHEPTFKSADFMARISPLPVFVIGSTSTQWVTPEATRKLFSLAREPKRLAMVTAHDHKYSDNTEGFFNALRDGLGWVQQHQR